VFDRHRLTELLTAFDLGEGTISDRPVARGRVGEIWRLEASSGTWAVKTEPGSVSEAGVAPSARFQEASVAAGVPAPALRRSRAGSVYASAGGVMARVLSWVPMAPADPSLDAAAVGDLVGRLHGVAVAGSWTAADVEPWFSDPVGAEAWDALLAELTQRGAPFAASLGAHRDEMLALEGLLEPPRDLRWCHRDLFADNVRANPSGGLVVFDFDSSGPCDPAWELAFLLMEYATAEAPGHALVDRARARALIDAYAAAGGPGRLGGPGDFTMIIAVLSHITQVASRRWLEATDPADRDDLAAWAAEFTARPLTRRVIDHLLDASAG
jgi:hypothetical protein